MTEDQAQILALQALAYLAGDEAEREAFLTQSGLSPDEMKANATDSEFLGAVMDFLLGDENRLLACCENYDWPPELPARARMALPGATSGIWM
ncbi:MAG: DUF3572 family protein [Alphaproteobacteria bacterium]|nr:MAG: DUF3572 family protein [Alphaproteobacteria bacterium]